MNSPAASQLCPHCRRSTATPFGTSGVCLLCAGRRALTLDLEATDPFASAAPDAGLTSRSPFGGELPERIGPYAIIDEIGRGGMARVFVARQPRLDRLVALKVLSGPAASSDLAARFLREAHTVARLRHPNIIALHDSGRADGAIYFAMDYVEGGDLAARLRTRPFAPIAAAELIRKVAFALAYAHRQGVLHRDLKPSNILLDRDEPMLADFGLAAELEAGGDLTRISSVLGTPHYLAPETIAGGSAAASVASDLYSLGVVLYEMLAGRPPFAGATVADLVARRAAEEPPPLRQSAPAVPRDLETVCLKCLARDPARRYAHADALAEDLHRFLAGEPILARQPGFREQAARFVRRHRLLVTVSGATGLALAAGVVASTVLAIRATRAEKRASTEAANARALLEFFQTDILLQSKPDAQADRDLKLRTALDTAAARIGGRFANQPEIESTLRATLGEALHSLGEYAHAADQYAAAIRLRRQQAPDDAVTWRLIDRQSYALTQLSRHTEAERLLAPALAAQRRTLGPDHADTIDSEQTLASIWDGQDRLADALKLRRDLLARRARLNGPDAPVTLEAQNRLATTLLNLGQFAEAREILQRTLVARRRVLGAEAAPTLESLNDLAGANWAMGNLGEAEARFREVVPLTRRVLGPTHPDTLRSLGNLGHVLAAQGRLDEAAGTFEEAHTQMRATLGEGHQEVLRMAGALASVYFREGYFEKAEALCVEIIADSSRTLGAQHPEVLAARTQLGGILVAEGKFSDAERELRVTLTAHQTIDERRPVQFVAQSHLGAALTGLGRLAEAEENLLAAQRGFASCADQLTPRQVWVFHETHVRLAKLYRALGKPGEAAAWEQRLAELKAKR
ncbi:MAG: tetratricopeptide repeat protein [Opitutae bacterium]|nr:tetratricopeptide repeat protein [Opitutae bacterium]